MNMTFINSMMMMMDCHRFMMIRDEWKKIILPFHSVWVGPLSLFDLVRNVSFQPNCGQRWKVSCPFLWSKIKKCFGLQNSFKFVYQVVLCGIIIIFGIVVRLRPQPVKIVFFFLFFFCVVLCLVHTTIGVPPSFWMVQSKQTSGLNG